MDIFISIDAPDVTERSQRFSQVNQPEELRRLGQLTDLSRAIWKSWALRVGGSVLSEVGPSIRLQMPADYVDELPDLRRQYSHAVNSRVAVGIGTELEHADRALKAALKLGGDKVLPYSEYVEEALEDTKKEDLLQPMTKAVVAMNPGAFSGASHPSAPKVDKPVPSQGEHSEAQSVYDLLNDQDQPAAPEGTHAAQDFEQQLHGHAQAQQEADQRVEMVNGAHAQAVRHKVVEALQLLQAQAPVMDQIRQSAPDAYNAMVALAQSCVELARQVRGATAAIGQSQAMAKAEPLVKMALIHNDPKKPKVVYRIQNENGEGPYEQDSLDSGFPQTKFDLPERSNKDFYQPLPENDFSPEDYEEFMGQDPDTGQGAGHYSFGFEHPHHAIKWFGSEGINKLYDHGYRLKEIPASKVYRSGSGQQVFFEHHASYHPAKVKDAADFNHPTEPPKKRGVKMTKEELAKIKLPMPHSSAHAHQTLPVGSRVDYKQKVQHGDGSTGWVQMRAGQIMSQDGHAISSRNPKGR